MGMAKPNLLGPAGSDFFSRVRRLCGSTLGAPADTCQQYWRDIAEMGMAKPNLLGPAGSDFFSYS